MVPSHKTLLRGEWPDSQYERFVKFVGSLSETFACPLEVPLDLKYCGLKKFCSDLIEGLPHPFTSDFARAHLGADARMSISFSLFLYRKTLPSSPPSIHAFIDKMSEPSSPCDPEFKAYCKSWIKRNMRGWDRGYFERVTSQTLPLTACGEYKRSDGGSRGLHAGTRLPYDDYVGYATLSETPFRQLPDGPPPISRVVPVDSGGKWRVITTPPVMDNHLRPLHQKLYDSLSRFKWLLRGDAKPSSFKDFVRVDGEEFVSGDYESATDNLNMDLQSFLLECLLDECVEVPLGIKQHAMMSFTDNQLVCGVPRCKCGGYRAKQRRGQMMGQLLSFPLLCLVNYLTFSFSVGTKVPVRINGDDIVARMTSHQTKVWMDNVKRSGLVLSKGKTLVHKKYFTLNSSMFRASSNKVRVVPFVRARCIDRHEEGTLDSIVSLRGRFRSMCVGLGTRRRFPFVVQFLDANRHSIYASRRSLTRGLGLRVNQNELRASSMWHRELYYLQNPEEPELPPSVSDLRIGGIPAGFVQKSSYRMTKSEIRMNEDRMAMMMTTSHWADEVVKQKDGENMWWSQLRQGCSPWGLGSLVNKKMLRMLKMKRNEAWRWAYMQIDESHYGKSRMTKGKTTWVWQPSLQNNDVKNSRTEIHCPTWFSGYIDVTSHGFSFAHAPPPSLQ